MNKLEYTIEINAPKEKVWYALWDKTNYSQWTTAFCEGSKYKGTLVKGSKMYFLDPNNNGMVSRIHENIPFLKMEFMHLSEIHNGIEAPIDDQIKKWTGCIEAYKLIEKDNITHLIVRVDSLGEFTSFFENSFPKALQLVKNIAENPFSSITVSNFTKESIEKVWSYYTNENHIINWNFASEDWCCPKAENNLQEGKSFNYFMASKNGEHSFEFKGRYTRIITNQLIEYTIEDGRKVNIEFYNFDSQTLINITFEPETENSQELQRMGWQAILDNFIKYLNDKK